MRYLSLLTFAGAALAARPFLDVVDTGFEDYLGGQSNWTEGTLPSLQDIRSIPDFEYAAKQVLADDGWAFYRLAAGQEWGELHTHTVVRLALTPFVSQATATTLKSGTRSSSGLAFSATWSTCVRTSGKTLVGLIAEMFVVEADVRCSIELFGYNFSAPFFIAPAANAAHGHERAELNFAEAAGDEDIMYNVSSGDLCHSLSSLHVRRPRSSLAKPLRRLTLSSATTL